MHLLYSVLRHKAIIQVNGKKLAIQNYVRQEKILLAQ